MKEYVTACECSQCHNIFPYHFKFPVEMTEKQWEKLRVNLNASNNKCPQCKGENRLT